MATEPKKEKIKKASENTRKVLKAYIVGLIVAYVMASILSSYWGFDIAGNDLLLQFAIFIGIAIVSVQAYATWKQRQIKKLEKEI